MEDVGDPEEPMQSKTNIGEAKMVTALVRHLCRQGKYKPGEIAVLTPYMGQLKMLKGMLDEVVELIIGERDLADSEASDAGVQTGVGAVRVECKHACVRALKAVADWDGGALGVMAPWDWLRRASDGSGWR
ncbi:hypothetical protein DM02DRAFT_635863 [Periconia macrospinosa]|uniref:DNA2/NAM7 helicase-like C-terminal domain-containing protein n=1 Tax=Periconia macrospinosa TaxID=97972 RepID=A0A2V1D1E3_9PLEO|nr:hypothetical protein DM02DRAFT_635863 [Periconia macrospinosa]